MSSIPGPSPFVLSQFRPCGTRHCLRGDLDPPQDLAIFAALYLAAAGVGTIGLMDADVVDLSNVQRQGLHTTADIGKPKVDSGARTLTALSGHPIGEEYCEEAPAGR